MNHHTTSGGQTTEVMLDSRQALPAPGLAVPFNRPPFMGSELNAIYNAIVENKHISGAGSYTDLCESYLSEYYEAPVLLTSSCTHALEMSAQLLELTAGDEVIVPSFTFV